MKRRLEDLVPPAAPPNIVCSPRPAAPSLKREVRAPPIPLVEVGKSDEEEREEEEEELLMGASFIRMRRSEPSAEHVESQTWLSSSPSLLVFVLLFFLLLSLLELPAATLFSS